MSAQFFQCPRCGATVVWGSSFCPGCGAAFTPHAIPAKKKSSLVGLWIALGVLGLCGFCGLIGRIGDSQKVETTKTEENEKKPSNLIDGNAVSATPTPVAPPAFSDLKQWATPLINLKREEYEDRELKEFDDLIGPLRQIPKDSKDYKEAQTLLRKLVDKAAAVGAEKLILGSRPQNSSWDGNVAPAQEYLKQALNDYSSSEYLGWSKVAKIYEGSRPFWHTTVRLRAKNAFGAYIVKDVTFYIQQGQVVKVKGM